jgi:hypothetical protein
MCSGQELLGGELHAKHRSGVTRPCSQAIVCLSQAIKAERSIERLGERVDMVLTVLEAFVLLGRHSDYEM